MIKQEVCTYPVSWSAHLSMVLHVHLVRGSFSGLFSIRISSRFSRLDISERMLYSLLGGRSGEPLREGDTREGELVPRELGEATREQGLSTREEDDVTAGDVTLAGGVAGLSE